ncbi:flagellar basal body rod protein FlgB [Lentibacillus sp. CBA3610]|uniref:flagellar basal body rod protein FlgB n=1 Tax=Lentibacillus sp. CBA3610 TaxID=2518176 RepID=UPI001595A96F|nr:flagellar basal body rod protein FlgB [Lentibacillus sp. CBA3610]QKY69026.1 flagellar basal body rod protein FlgB [Lentibacillus sp. CBA3610]
MEFFSGSFQTLENSLKYASAKNRTISNNIANVDTPGYKAKDVEFKNVLNDELNASFGTKRTHSKHLPFNSLDRDQTIHTVTRQGTAYNHSGNNVDIDKEMAELGKNQIYYQALVDRINGKFSTLKTVIGGGN